jgi:hypothetical protein
VNNRLPYGGNSIGRILFGFFPIAILITAGFGASDAGIVLTDDENPSAVSASTKEAAAFLVLSEALSGICNSTPVTRATSIAHLRFGSNTQWAERTTPYSSFSKLIHSPSFRHSAGCGPPLSPASY